MRECIALVEPEPGGVLDDADRERCAGEQRCGDEAEEREHAAFYSPTRFFTSGRFKSRSASLPTQRRAGLLDAASRSASAMQA